MERILFINACVRDGSRTLRLARAVLDRLSGEVEEVALADLSLRSLDRQALQSQFAEGQAEERLARQFAEADTLVIAAPYWNLCFPSLLMTYIENICLVGVTFCYGPDGRPKSFCRAKRLYYVTTSGGWIGKNDYGYTYIKNLATAFFGVKKTHCIAAEGLDIYPDRAEELLLETIGQVREAQL